MVHPHPPHGAPASGHDHVHAHGPGQHGDPHDHHAHISGHGLAAFRFGTLLNLGLVLAEAAVGFAVGSMALLADAGHNLGDVLGLVLAWIAARLALRRPSPRHTYGMARSTILAALLNAALLLVACGALATESIRRLHDPAPVPGLVVMGMAALGFVVNTATAMLFWRGRRHDLNERGAFLHMAADAAVSLAVVVVGGLMALTGWHWLDPVAGLAIAVAILLSGLGLLRESVELSLDAVPRGLDLGQIEGALRGTARRELAARPARVAAVDHGDGADRAPRARRQPRHRPAARRGAVAAAAALRHRPQHDPVREHGLRAALLSCRSAGRCVVPRSRTSRAPTTAGRGNAVVARRHVGCGRAQGALLQRCRHLLL